MREMTGTKTADEAELKELQKKRRLCLQHLRRGALLFGSTAIVLVVVQLFLGIHLWMPFATLGVISLTLVGDAIGYYSCGRKIRRMEHE